MTALVGHEEARGVFVDSWRGGQMHHAWLLTGPRGIGKRTFADAAARMILAGATDFEIAPENRHASAFDAGAHPDYRLLERRENDRGTLAQYIAVDQVRGFMPVLAQTPSLAEWRVVTVDSACEMNRASANALLKSLEEPPRRTIFLLVCHTPGRLLPTVRSRCRTLRLRPLSDLEVANVLRQHDVDDVEALTAIAAGAPGRALRFAGLDIGALTNALRALEQADEPRARDIALDLAQQLALKAAQGRYEAFLELAPAYIAEAAKQTPAAALAGSLALWEEARNLAGEALSKYLDPRVVTFDMARLVGRLNPSAQQRAA